MVQIPKKPVPAPEPPARETYPFWRVHDWNGGLRVSVLGYDHFYEDIQLTDDCETEAEARAEAVKVLRELADRIEKGEH